MIGAASTNNLFASASTGAGTTTMYIGNASINVTSDVRVKLDIEDWHGDALGLLERARIVEFNYDRKAISDDSDYGPSSRGRYIGMTAQDMIEWAPWAVNAGDATDCSTCRLGLPCPQHSHTWKTEYEHLVPLIVAAIRQQQAEINALKARMN